MVLFGPSSMLDSPLKMLNFRITAPSAIEKRPQLTTRLGSRTTSCPMWLPKDLNAHSLKPQLGKSQAINESHLLGRRSANPSAYTAGSM
jgi:hypothetical protein